MTLIAAYQTLLHRYSGQTDIIIGSPVAGRNRSELENLIGFFLNMLVLRSDLSGNPTFRELLVAVRENCLEAYAHQDLPFEKLVEGLRPKRDLGHTPLFQVTFALQHVTRDVEFARPGGTPLLMDVSIPEGEGPHPAVILVHGGGWEAGDKSTYIKPWFPMLTDARLAWFSINYRLAPLHPHPAAVRDIEAAITFIRDHARSYRIDPAKIALMGESAGGHLAALVGSRAESTLAAVVSFYGIRDIPLWAEQRGRMPENIAQYLAGADPLEASPVRYIRKSMPPHLFVHGTTPRAFARSRHSFARAGAG